MEIHDFSSSGRSKPAKRGVWTSKPPKSVSQSGPDPRNFWTLCSALGRGFRPPDLTTFSPELAKLEFGRLAGRLSGPDGQICSIMRESARFRENPWKSMVSHGLTHGSPDLPESGRNGASERVLWRVSAPPRARIRSPRPQFLTWPRQITKCGQIFCEWRPQSRKKRQLFLCGEDSLVSGVNIIKKRIKIYIYRASVTQIIEFHRMKTKFSKHS